VSLPADRITSSSNPRYRQWKRDVEHPEAAPWLPVEGLKQIRELADRRIVRLLLVEEAADLSSLALDCGEIERVVRLPRRLLDGLSGVRTGQGWLAFLDRPGWNWEQLKPCIVYLDGIQDPGNLGTILRSAAAFDFSLVTGPGSVACFNRKVIRGSAGYLFQVPFLEGVSAAELSSRGYRLWLADAGGNHEVGRLPGRPPLAFVVGREGGGASRVPPGTGKVRIPMVPGVDSLNAGVAASLLMYEAHRRWGAPEELTPGGMK
jgi:RNA methyltransferase, TrmH family